MSKPSCEIEFGSFTGNIARIAAAQGVLRWKSFWKRKERWLYLRPALSSTACASPAPRSAAERRQVEAIVSRLRLLHHGLSMLCKTLFAQTNAFGLENQIVE